MVNYDLHGGLERGFPVSMPDSPYCWVKGDVLSREQTWRHTIGADLVINCIWSDAGAVPIDSSEYVTTTTAAANNLMHCAAVRGTSRYIQVSTADVYGARSRGASLESDAPNPDTAAAGARGAADILVKSFRNQWDLGILIVRPTNLYGPGFDPDSLMGRLIVSIAAGRTPPPEFTEETGRDWLHIDDFCAAVDFIIRNGDVGEIYNIGSGEIVSDKSLVKMVASECRKKPTLRWSEPEQLTGIRVSTSKLQRLGWQPRYSLAEALPEVVASFLKTDSGSKDTQVAD